MLFFFFVKNLNADDFIDFNMAYYGNAESSISRIWFFYWFIADNDWVDDIYWVFAFLSTHFVNFVFSLLIYIELIPLWVML
jgi:hypothetical protein